MKKLLLAAAVSTALHLHADIIAIPSDIAIDAVSAASSFSPAQAPENLINGSGLVGERHDADTQSKSMWHTTHHSAPSAPAPGLPATPAWVRFGFKEPRKIDEICVWNHNQAGLTDRGFRKTRVYGTTDGTTWFKITATDTVELPRGGDTATTIPVHSAKPIKGVILAAETNYGSTCYGLSEVKFEEINRVAEEAAPFPKDITCAPGNCYRHRKDGQAGREFTVRFSGEKLFGQAELTIAVEGGPTETVSIPASRFGITETAILLPPGVSVDKAAKVSVTLRRGAKSVSKTTEVPARRQWTVFLYPHSHVDIGYTQTQAVVEKINVRNMKVGMEIAEAGRKIGVRYVWNPEVTWGAESFLKAATPAEKAQFDRAVKAGDVGLDASFAHLNTSACGDEELMHYFQGGLRLRRSTGAKVDTMAQMDVPGMTWGMPTVAAQCGIRGILDFPNGFDRMGSIHTHFQRPFWWVSPDGKSRMLYIQGPRYDWGWEWKARFTQPSPYPAYENPTPAWVQDYPPVADRMKTADPTKYFIPIGYLLSETQRLEQEGQPHDYFTMTWSMSDNSLVDADLPEAVKDWNSKYAYPKLVIASASEIIDAYIKKYGDKFPEKRGDLTEYWTDGLGTDALRIGYNRLSKERLVQTEALRTMLAPKSGDAEFNTDSYDAWRYILLGSEHTWGYFRPERPIAKEVEKVKASYFEQGRERSTRVLADTLALAAQPAGDAVTVFNTLSFPRTGVVALPAGVTGLADAPVQKLASGETVFLARDIPALGAKSWKIAPASTAPSPFGITATTLENDRVRVELDPKTGDITHLTDKRTGRDFVDTKSPYALNSYRYVKGGEAPAKATGPTEVKISAGDNGPVCASLVVVSKAEGCNKLTREVRLVAGSEKVELIDTVDKVSTRAKEGVHFGFAFNVPGGKMHMDIPWGVMNPMKDQLPGSNKNWLAFQRFVDISNADSGVTWCAIEAPIIEIGDITANLIGGGHDPRQWRQEIPETQTVFSWALNNHWHTNFPLEQGGVIPFRYAILPHGAYDPVVANRFGLEQNRPLLAARTAGTPKLVVPVAIDNPRVFLSTAKPADDASGATVLRLRSLSDKPETVNLTFPSGAPKSLLLCGGDELPKEPSATKLALPPYGCLSLRLEK